MKIAIIGFFARNTSYNGGQEHKTRTLATALKTNAIGEIVEVDTLGWKNRPIALIQKIKKTVHDCDTIIMLPAQNGVQVFSTLLLYYKKKYGKRIFYDVIGGWLPSLLFKKKWLSNVLKLFDGIWVETTTMKNDLETMGFKNVVVIPNFKDLCVLSEDKLVYAAEPPYKLCTFSRVMKEKGIEDAVNAVKCVNEKLGFTAYTLDIYGRVDSNQVAWFEELKQQFPSYVHYCGCVESNESVEKIRNYFALLFPTRFYTEGVPGTIIDSYASGVPVISAKWESFSDVVEELVTGIGYEFNNTEMLTNILLSAVNSPEKFNNLKQNCLKKACDFTSGAGIGAVRRCIEQ